MIARHQVFRYLQTHLRRSVGLRLLLGMCAAFSAPWVSAAVNDGLLDLLRRPDSIGVVCESGEFNLTATGADTWRGGDCEVITRRQGEGLAIQLHAPKCAVKRIHVRWKAKLDPAWQCLGDQWERSYGDLHWAKLDAARVMPWYFMLHDGRHTDGYGVRTGPAAFCHWQADPAGVSLWADVRCGGMGIQLGQRRLEVCTVVTRRGEVGESAFAATRAFCRVMCPKPRLPRQPVYGFNDWYCFYGKNSAEFTRQATAFITGLSPQGPNRPFIVVDDGWQSKSDTASGPWDQSNERFPSMAGLAKEVKQAGARPGIWIRLLIATKEQPQAWRLERDPHYLDPTVPEIRRKVKADVARLCAWGYELIKHDYSTNDLTGRWGFDMKDGITKDGWAFANRGLTTAEVILDHYRDIREAAGDAVIIGCNTVSHLSAGIFELQRIGDDTSGKDWARTRKMGVNTLAFRAPQHDTFYAVDADCVGLTQAEAIPWAKNGQWLDLLARSGTPLFVSLPSQILTEPQVEELRQAMAMAARRQPLAEPLDWMETLTPARWRVGEKTRQYQW